MVSASISPDASFRKSPAPLPFTQSPIEFFNITAIPRLPLFSPTVGMSSSLSTSSAHAYSSTFVVPSLVADLNPVLFLTVFGFGSVRIL